MTGVLAGLEEATGADLRRCRAWLGTSAGSIVAAGLAAGRRPRRAAAGAWEAEASRRPRRPPGSCTGRGRRPERSGRWARRPGCRPWRRPGRGRARWCWPGSPRGGVRSGPSRPRSGAGAWVERAAGVHRGPRDGAAGRVRQRERARGARGAGRRRLVRDPRGLRAGPHRRARLRRRRRLVADERGRRPRRRGRPRARPRTHGRAAPGRAARRGDGRGARVAPPRRPGAARDAGAGRCGPYGAAHAARRGRAGAGGGWTQGLALGR
jgi:hypothetical protein